MALAVERISSVLTEVQINRDALFLSKNEQFSAEVPEDVFPETRTTNQIPISDESSAGGVDRPFKILENIHEACSCADEVLGDVAEAENNDGYGPLYIRTIESSAQSNRNIPSKYHDYDMAFSVIPKRLSVS